MADTEARLKNDIRQKQQEAGFVSHIRVIEKKQKSFKQTKPEKTKPIDSPALRKLLSLIQTPKSPIFFGKAFEKIGAVEQQAELRSDLVNQR